MGLLQSLGLKPTPAMQHRAAVAEAKKAPTAAKDIAATQGVAPGTPMAGNGYAPKDAPAADAGKLPPEVKLTDAERAKADKLLPALGKARQELAARVKELEVGKAKLKQLIGASSGDKKKYFEKKMAALDGELGPKSKALEQTIQDIEDIDDPNTDRKTLASILARGGSKDALYQTFEHDAEVGFKDGALGASSSGTTVEVKNGVAKVDKQEVSATLGLDGLDVKTKDESKREWEDGSVSSSTERNLKIGPDGIAGNTSRTIETTQGEQTTKLEQSSGFSVGPGGAKKTKSQSKTNADGSGLASSSEEGIERGGGKLGYGGGSSETKTGADGKALTKGSKGSAGMVAGEDGIGGYADVSAEIGTQRKGGFQTGAVGGLHPNVTCNVGEPKGEPPLYPVTMKVALGAEIKLSAKQAKEGASSKGGVEVELGGEIALNATYQYTEQELSGYVEAVKAANSGKMSDATRLEFKVIQAGVTQGWAVAQGLYKSGGQPLAKAMVDQLRRAGDSVSLSTTTKAGAKGSLDVKAVSLEAGYSEQDDRSTTATLNEEGTVDIAADAAHTQKASGKAGVSYGLVKGSGGKSHTWKTSFGYEIVLDPKKDQDGAAVAQLQKLALNGTEAEYEAFLVKFKDRVTLKGRKKGKAEADSETLGLGIGGVEASIGAESGLAQQTKTDAQGKLVEKTTVGSEGVGGGIKVGDFAIGDSKTDQAVAHSTGDGDATLDLSTTKQQTSYEKLGKKVKGMLPEFMGGEAEKPEGPGQGVLAKAAGAEKKEEEPVSFDKFGIKLNKADLEKIGKIANNESQWTKAAGRIQEYDDWKAVAARIRAAKGDPGVVAHELAEFVGGDKIHRLEVLKRLIRPAGSVAIGKGYEYPDSLKDKAKDYERLVMAEAEKPVLALVEQGQAAKAIEMGNKLAAEIEALRAAWDRAKDFSKPGIKSEMMSAIAHRKTAIAEALRQAEGRNSEADRKKAAVDAFGRLNRELFGYKQREASLFAQVDKLLDGRDRIIMNRRPDAEPAMRALSDMYAVWKKDLAEAQALAKEGEVRDERWKDHQPDTAKWEKLKKACLMSDY